MKKQASAGSGFLRSGLALLALAALGLAVLPNGAEALSLQGTAGNALVRNTITMTYADANGTAQTPVSSHVDVTVQTVPAAPTIFNVDASGTTDGTGATQLYHAWVRTNSNGPGSVSLSAADGSPTNMTVSTTGPTAIASVYLGSTIFDPNGNTGIIGANLSVSNNASITVAVPNDQQLVKDDGTTPGATGANSAVNALALNDIVYLTDGSTYYGPFTVTATVNNAPGTGTTAATSSLTLTNKTGATIPATGTFTPAAGWQIEEAKQFTFTVTEGIITNAALAASWVTTMTGTAGGLNGTGTVTTNAKEGLCTIAKYVRNVTTSAAGSGTPVTVTADTALGSQTYYPTGVNCKPGDTLEYLVVLNNVGLGGTTGQIASDLVPTYSTLVAGSAYGTSGGAPNVFAHAKLGANETDMAMAGTGLNTVGFGGATGTTAGSTMTFDLGTGSLWGTGGNLASGATEYVIYRVTLK